MHKRFPEAMRTRSTYAVLLIASLALVFTACSGSEEPASPSEADPVAVETATAQAKTVPRTLRYSGTIQGARRVPLSTKMMGTVTQLAVEEGDRVTEGELLARVQSQNVEAQKRRVQARLQEAEAALQNAGTNFKRIEALREEGSATQKEFDDAQTAYKRAEARVEALKSRLDEIESTLDYATIRAPIDGYVVEKRSEQGALAAPGRPLLVVETLDALEAVVQVPAADINRFSVGDSVTVEVGAAGDVRRTGVVSQVNPSGNYASRQFSVQVRLQRSDDSSIKSGMYAQVLFPGEQAEAITVPQEAIVERGQLNGLYTVTDSTVLLRWVRLGEAHGTRIEVLSGLRGGERYVVNASQRLLDGQPVQAGS
jgi:RND family efflux transporter MFP subunit